MASRYNNYVNVVTPIIDVQRGHRMYPAMLDPDIPKTSGDLYIVTTFGDRLDLLALQYYKDPYAWWYIAAANPELRKDSLFLDVGLQLRIPDPNFPDNVLNALQDFNNNR